MTFHPKPKKKHITAAIILAVAILMVHTDLEPDSITWAQEQIHEYLLHHKARRTLLLIGRLNVSTN